MLSAPVKEFLWHLIVTLVVIALLSVIFYPIITKAEGTIARVSWILPACYNDGTPATPPATGCGTQSPLPPADILSVTVKWSGQITGQVTLTGTPTQTDIPIPCGSTNIVVFVTTKPTAKYAGPGGETNSVSHATGVQCRANPPSAVTVN